MKITSIGIFAFLLMIIFVGMAVNDLRTGIASNILRNTPGFNRYQDFDRNMLPGMFWFAVISKFVLGFLMLLAVVGSMRHPA